jgi:dGTP triphosphohydrolase
MSELKYFNGAKTEKAITKRYRELAKKYHPDNATSDEEVNYFTEIMKNINAEHQEVLVLLKYKAFATATAKLKEEPNFSQASKVVSSFASLASLFVLTNQQKQELANQGKNIVNTLIDAFVQNNLRR